MIPENGYYRNWQKRCREVTVSCRKTLEIAGTWTQYSDRNRSVLLDLISRLKSVTSTIGSSSNLEESIDEFTIILGNTLFLLMS